MGHFWTKNSFLDINEIANFKPTLEFYLKFHSNNFSEILRLLTLLVSTLGKERKLKFLFSPVVVSQKVP